MALTPLRTAHEKSIIDAGALLVAVCHGAAAAAGWWKGPEPYPSVIDLLRNPQNKAEKFIAGAIVGQKLALIHSEISEGLEGDRKKLMDDKLPHRLMLEVELADAIIRICDLAGAMNLDLGGAIMEKLAFNAQRPDHKLEIREGAGGKAY